MKRSWYEKNPGVLRDMEAEIAARYPDLRVVMEQGTVYIRGSFPIMDATDVLDRFQIEIELPADFPESIPVLREVGGRIPWHENRHVNNGTGEACPIVPEEWLVRTERDSILAFLDGPVRNFFLGQILIEAGQPWPFGERSHGIDGLFEAYEDITGISDRNTIVRYLECLSRDVFKGHWACPCGSGKHLRNCHLEQLKALQAKVPAFVARSALARIDEQLQLRRGIRKHKR
jgi:hypothetical protein